jgi:hypothetical protein
VKRSSGIETPADSIDNGGNGYVDDIYSWNFAAGTNDPSDKLLMCFNTVGKTNIATTPTLNAETDVAAGLRNSRFYRVHVEQ